MSLEWWGGGEADDGAISCRLPACGHTARLHDLDAKWICEVCGHSGSVYGLAIKDFVPTPDLNWPQVTCTKTRRLKRHRQRLRGSQVSSVEDLVATLSAQLVHRIALRVAPLRLQSRPSCAKSFLVVRTATAGCAVHSGTVELPEGAVLLLAGRGAHFNNTTFRGGAVMCAGAQYSGTFRNCAFHGTAVYAVHGAAATFRSCLIADGSPGLTVSGGATVATLTACTILNCRTSIVAEAGANAHASACVLRSHGCAVIANGAGTHVALTACTAQGSSQGGYGVSGVGLGGGTVRVACSTIDNFIIAVAGDGTVEMDQALVKGSVQGVKLQQGSRACVRGCDVSITRRPAAASTDSLAIMASAHPSSPVHMQLERSAVHASVQGVRGIIVGGGAAVAATLCALNCSGVGVSVGGGRAVLAHCRSTSPCTCLLAGSPSAAMTVRGGRYSSADVAMQCQEGATIVASNCEIDSSCTSPDACVVMSMKGAHVRLQGCTVLARAAGVCALDASVTSVHTVVTDVVDHDGDVGAASAPDRSLRQRGVLCGHGAGYSCKNGKLTVRGGRVMRCVFGVEVDGGDVSLDTVAVSECVVGAVIKGGAAGDVSRCEFRGLRAQGGVCGGLAGALLEAARQRTGEDHDCGVLLRAEHVSVAHCSFEGFGFGVVVATAREVAVRHCTFTAARAPSTCVQVQGPLALEDCKFVGVPEEATAERLAQGVHVAEGVACVIRRCAFDTISGVAVVADTGSSVSAVECTVAGGSRYGFDMDGDAVFAAQDCSILHAQIAVYIGLSGGSFTGKRLTLQATRVGVHLAPGRERATAESRRVVVKVVDSEVSGARTGVKACPQYAEVVLVRSRIVDCERGVFIDGPIDARLKGCTISRCGAGVVVGTSRAGLSERCPVCDVSGESAFEQAVMSQVFNRVEFPRCPHEGAIPVMCMAECEVAQCQQVGVCVKMLGQIRAHGVTARRCGVGFVDEYIGFRGEYAGCKAVGCDVGAQMERVGHGPDWSLGILTSAQNLSPEELEVLPDEGEE